MTVYDMNVTQECLPTLANGFYIFTAENLLRGLIGIKDTASKSSSLLSSNRKL